MITWNRVVGDTNDTIVARLDGVTNLSGVTAIEAHVWRADVAPTTLVATITDAAARTVTVNLATWINTAAAAVWDLEIQATFGVGNPKTWPELGTAKLYIRAQGG